MVHKNRFNLASVLCLLAILAVGACASLNASPQVAVNSSANQPQPGQAPSGVADGDFGILENERGLTVDELVVQQGQQQPESPASGERIVLKSATLALVADDTGAKFTEISSMAEEMGGWVVSSNAYRATNAASPEALQGSITVRVPADRLDEAMQRIKNGAHEVQSENVTGQDVTQQFVDLNSRLTNLEAAEAQLQQIMTDAHKTEDVLAVYSQLVSIRGEIETIRGQIQYFRESAAFSSIQVNLTPTPITQPLEIAGWRPQETARNAFQALINLFQGIADVGIVLVVFVLPLAILIGIPLYVVLRLRRRRPMPPAVPPAPAADAS
jgi:hypothetical protein